MSMRSHDKVVNAKLLYLAAKLITPLIVKFHIFYVLNMHIKFHSNQMLFIIQSINLFFYTQI